MPCSGCLALHKVNPNSKIKYGKRPKLNSRASIFERYFAGITNKEQVVDIKYWHFFLYFKKPIICSEVNEPVKSFSMLHKMHLWKNLGLVLPIFQNWPNFKIWTPVHGFPYSGEGGEETGEFFLILHAAFGYYNIPQPVDPKISAVS